MEGSPAKAPQNYLIVKIGARTLLEAEFGSITKFFFASFAVFFAIFAVKVLLEGLLKPSIR